MKRKPKIISSISVLLFISFLAILAMKESSWEHDAEFSAQEEKKAETTTEIENKTGNVNSTEEERGLMTDGFSLIPGTFDGEWLNLNPAVE